MSKEILIQKLKDVQTWYSNALADHATVNEPTAFQQSIQDRLFAGFDRVTAQLDMLLKV